METLKAKFESFTNGIMNLFNEKESYHEKNRRHDEDLNQKVLNAKKETIERFENDPDYLKLKAHIMNGAFVKARHKVEYTHTSMGVQFEDGTTCRIYRLYLNNFGDSNWTDGVTAYVLKYSKWENKIVLDIFDKLNWNLPSITQTWDHVFSNNDTIIINDSDFKQIESVVKSFIDVKEKEMNEIRSNWNLI